MLLHISDDGDSSISPKDLLQCFPKRLKKKNNISKQLYVLTGLNQLLEVFGTFTLQCCDKAWQPEREPEYTIFLVAELKEMEIVKHFKSYNLKQWLAAHFVLENGYVFQTPLAAPVLKFSNINVNNDMSVENMK